MTSINVGQNEECAECHRGPVRRGIPVFRNPGREGGGIDTEVWCLECARNLLHSQDTGRG